HRTPPQKHDGRAPARGVRVFEYHRDVVRRLYDFEWEGHVSQSRDTRQETTCSGVCSGALREQLLLLLGRPDLVWNLSPFHDTFTGRDSQITNVSLDVPGSSIEHLPDAIQVGYCQAGVA